ncbi:hypothetical protein ACFPK9_14725 [Rubritalea spongiae]|uniref:DUF1593 domain-containing protein n=1 Tax=Rubritalea spongiae TaxID=430797 RepID=A0ABW5DXW0_9BACT
MKLTLSYILTLLLALGSSMHVFSKEKFNPETDLFIAQFDNLPDNDDVHSQAALGCILAHPDYEKINFFCATGAWGNQWAHPKSDNWEYINSRSLFKLAFGTEAKPKDTPEQRAKAKWVDANGPKNSKQREENLNFAAEVIKNKTKPILTSGGKVWIMEAGQSDLTAAWVAKLIAEGVTNTKSDVILVQHSHWNEKWTTPEALAYVKEHTNYTQIDDGNSPYGDGPDRGDETPNYKNEAKNFIPEAISKSNPNSHARTLWTKANEIATNTQYKGLISKGSVDFSDTVEGMWILGLSDKCAGLTTVRGFWDKFVINP